MKGLETNNPAFTIEARASEGVRKTWQFFDACSQVWLRLPSTNEFVPEIANTLKRVGERVSTCLNTFTGFRHRIHSMMTGAFPNALSVVINGARSLDLFAHVRAQVAVPARFSPPDVRAPT
jgi:hypothetical protein